MLQNLIVALIVCVSAVYAASKYLPASWRRRIVYALSRGGAGQSLLTRWFDTGSSCGSGCDSCKACAEPEPETPPTRRVIKLHLQR